MAKFVPDIKSDRWVIIAPGRISRPHDNTPATEIVGQCVFCPGNEILNPLELFRIGGNAGDKSWRVRVIANKFPITDLHEVIIHGPDHGNDIDTLPLDQVELIIQTYRQRYNYHVQNNHGQVMIFNNHDVHAGASIKHPHSQVVVVPRQINLDTVVREPVNNLITETEYFYLYCPDFSQWPYEAWIAPKEAGHTFGEISDEQIKEVAVILQRTLAFVHKRFSVSDDKTLQAEKAEDVPYNYYIYHGPDWYLRIIPRLVHRAGFELGTGLSVNIVDPTDAAEEYKKGLGT